MKKSKCFERLPLAMSATLLWMANAADAALVPIGVNDVYTYNKHDSAVPQQNWVMYMQGLEYVDVAGQQFIKLAQVNEDGAGSYDELLVRSTDTAVYAADGSAFFQLAPVGTTWSYASFKDTLGSGTIHNEITSIETVTVPYGTFNNTYVLQAYFDPDDPSFANTPFWFDYYVPDVGYVKQVDYWSSRGPVIMELAQVSTVPLPAAFWMFCSGGLLLTPLVKGRHRTVV